MEETWVVIVRAIIAFFTLLIFTRILGKQQMGNLSYFDYINGIVIGSIGGTLATDLSAKAWVHWVGLTTFVFLTFVFQISTLKSRYFSKMVNAQPAVVVQNGMILEDNLKKMRISMDELMMLLRRKDMFDITQVEYAILETDGQLSVLPKADSQPVTGQDMHITRTPAKLVTEVIMNQTILEQNLKQRNKDHSWLMEQLKAQGINDVKEVAFAAILPNDTLYIDKYKDDIKECMDISDYKGPF
ncbi:DUF421 domain-containing protein [Ammoniphilus sp. CFH 90114]|nr:DUF421 domain-containing protein [Ammoniphilus sp. CFH 90114]